MWCASSPTRFTGPIVFFQDHEFTPFCYTFGNHLLNICSIMRKPMLFVSTTVQQLTSQKILCIVLRGLFGDRITNRRLWPPCSRDLSPNHFYLCSMLKDKVHNNDLWFHLQNIKMERISFC
jgi:hypothetical protein